MCENPVESGGKLSETVGHDTVASKASQLCRTRLVCGLPSRFRAGRAFGGAVDCPVFPGPNSAVVFTPHASLNGDHAVEPNSNAMSSAVCQPSFEPSQPTRRTNGWSWLLLGVLVGIGIATMWPQRQLTAATSDRVFSTRRMLTDPKAGEKKVREPSGTFTWRESGAGARRGGRLVRPGTRPCRIDFDASHCIA